ncbi:MAG: hypothetical protein QFB87_00155 [Patescibacteria group bacterium]|nr:hypothetical protein [Patescibacteria group bacterium]
MHLYILPLIAALLCAVCNGSAAVLQKISADKEKNVQSLDAGLLWRLAQNKTYLAGIVLDILGWVFTLYAVHYLPLFLVEAIIAANIVFTALLERFVRHQALSRKAYTAISIILAGLVLIALASAPEKAHPISRFIELLILLSPLPIALAGLLLARSKRYIACIGLAALGGLSFGDTSIIGRIFSPSIPLWHTLYSPQVFALIASGTLGVLLFSIALQRAQATIVNATMSASQTLIPALVGIVFLGDRARGGLWYLIFVGGALAFSGLFILTIKVPAKNTTV